MDQRHRIFIFVLTIVAAAPRASPQETPPPASPPASPAPPQAEVRAQVRKAYYSLAATQARLAIAVDLQGIARRARDVASERYEAGAVPRLEVVQADLNLEQAENEAAAVAGESDASRA